VPKVKSRKKVQSRTQQRIKDIRRGCKLLKNAEANTEYNREANAKIGVRTIAERKLLAQEEEESLYLWKPASWVDPTEHLANGLCILEYGSWRINVYRNERRRADFTVCCWMGTDHMYHPDKIEYCIKSTFGEETYRNWKRHVMSHFKDAMKYFLDELQSRYKGRSFYSFTCCDRSHKLLKQLGDERLVCQYPGIAYLLL